MNMWEQEIDWLQKEIHRLADENEFLKRAPRDFTDNEYARAIREAEDAALERVRKPCRWKQDEIDGYWETGCDNAHEFTTDGPIENKYKFCPYCGGKIALKSDRKDAGKGGR